MTAPGTTSPTEQPSEVPAEVDVLVVGAGLMGAMTAMSAGARGLSVLVVEQYERSHLHGSSHGSARIVRGAYPEEFYVRLTGRAFALWNELERRTATSLLRMTGGVDHGPARDIAGMGRQLTIAVDGDSAVVGTSRGTVRAGTVVLAAGAWMTDVAAVISGVRLDLPPLRVSQQQVFHFARDAGIAEWPTTVHKGALSTYSLPGGRDGGPGGACKMAEHNAPGYDTTARTRSGQVDPVNRNRMIDYVKEWMPGLIPKPFAEATCLYTMTENEDVLLDRIGPIVLCSPCSGHGAKFAPLIGELAADLVTRTGSGEPRFNLAAHGR